MYDEESFEGHVLIFTTGDDILPPGTIVYCFKDLGHEFIFSTERTYCGVTQFWYTDASRHKFKILQ
jgi:hypothetical protein